MSASLFNILSGRRHAGDERRNAILLFLMLSIERKLTMSRNKRPDALASMLQYSPARHAPLRPFNFLTSVTATQ